VDAEAPRDLNLLQSFAVLPLLWNYQAHGKTATVPTMLIGSIQQIRTALLLRTAEDEHTYAAGIPSYESRSRPRPAPRRSAVRPVLT